MPEQGGGGSVCSVSRLCPFSLSAKGGGGDDGGGRVTGAVPGRGPECVRQGEKTVVAPDTS